ncbi:hypothetical protein KTH_11560 [Thermosporothrix hazakensis]|nr:hypothetical protein KTH_11560 [Thermosporothrix hazakensis]
MTLLDPACGEGDLLLPLHQRDLAQLHLYGIEISAQRAQHARERLPVRTSILPVAFEGVRLPKESFSGILMNPPYMLVNGKRAEYRFAVACTEALVPGGILVAIVPARSAWNHHMASLWSQWYEDIRMWRFPTRREGETESPFEAYTQIVVIGRKRAQPLEANEREKERLLGYRWRKDAHGQEGWAGHTPPPALPEAPEPLYELPPISSLPHLEVRHASEQLMWEELAQHGAHRTQEWKAATCWIAEEEQRLPPAMPYTGPAHVAAELLTDILGGQVLCGPQEGPEARPYLFTAFVSTTWVDLPLDKETEEALTQQGVTRAQASQSQDYPVLGVLDLTTGQVTYYTDHQVFDFLQPWIPRLAERMLSQRQPLYQLQPEDWELAVISQFGRDKRLPNAPLPGLAPAQMHRVIALGRLLDIRRRGAIQGEPGTGKTRITTAVVVRQAYLWRYRNTMRAPHQQPDWIRQLRRCWLKNPRTLAMLDLEPVFGQRLQQQQGQAVIREDTTSRHIVAYRHRSTGRLLLPEEAGPRAFPALISTPKKVTKEFEKEIKAAWPQAETVLIERWRDILRWLERCATSDAPAVIAILSHSQSRAFGREWQPAVLERRRKSPIPPRSLEDAPQEPGHRGEKGTPLGDRHPDGELLPTPHEKTFFCCPDCFGVVRAIPGERGGEEQNPAKGKQREERADLLRLPVTSRRWFERRPRWCRCASRRNQERKQQGKQALRAPLWTQTRTSSVRKKYPGLTFAQWANIMDQLVRQAPTEPCAPARLLLPSVSSPASTGHLPPPSATRLEMSPLSPSYQVVPPPADSFSPYEYLHRFFRGCVGLTIIDESHNGRSRDTDIAHAHHQAMLSAQGYLYASGTHFGGDILGFFPYWYRFNPALWKECLHLGWDQIADAVNLYGVIQLWVKEYEEEASRGRGKVRVQTSTVAGPGISAKLIIYILAEMVYLQVLDVGAFMPPRIEIPEIVSMRDAQVEAAYEQAHALTAQCLRLEQALMREKETLFAAAAQGTVAPETLAAFQQKEQQTLAHCQQLRREAQERKQWAEQRDLAQAYIACARTLSDMAATNPVARTAQGTLPRWFAALPCSTPFELWQNRRDRWGESIEQVLLYETPALAWDHLYPMERKLIEIVQQERAAGRRCMIYIEQNEKRSMAQRLEWVLKQANISCWSLPNSVKAEDRQQAILDATSGKHTGTPIAVVIVPYARVNEGINLQSAVDTIIWYEMALNLYMLEQASRRAWRLGKREEVRIFYLAYAGSAAHRKLRKLGGQSGAAAAFAGEPARGALIEHAGADRTMLARFSASVEAELHELALLADEDELPRDSEPLEADDGAALKAAFARRAAEEHEALQRGRSWLGAQDHLPERLLLFASQERPSVWQQCPPPRSIIVLNETTAPNSPRPLRAAPALQAGPLKALTMQQETTQPSAPPPPSELNASQHETHPLAPSPEKAASPNAQEEPARPAPSQRATPQRPPTFVSRSALRFGNPEDIQRAQRKSRHCSRVASRTTPTQKQRAPVTALSLWEVPVREEEGRERRPRPSQRATPPTQRALW